MTRTCSASQGKSYQATTPFVANVFFRTSALVISSCQTTIDAVAKVTGQHPQVLTPASIMTSANDSKLAMFRVSNPESPPHLVVIDLPGLRTPEGNRQDRRQQSSLMLWARAAAKAGKSVIVRAYKGPQWTLPFVRELVGLPGWFMSKHDHCRFVPSASSANPSPVAKFSLCCILLMTFALTNTTCTCNP